MCSILYAYEVYVDHSSVEKLYEHKNYRVHGIYKEVLVHAAVYFINLYLCGLLHEISTCSKYR